MIEEKHLGTEIHRVSLCMKRVFDHALEKYELTGVQVRLLTYIKQESVKEDIFQRDIEEAFHIRRSSVTSAIQLLEKRGFIGRVKVPYDARLNKLILTSKTEDICDKIFAEIHMVENKLLEDFTKEELDLFYDMIDRISKKLDTMEGIKKEELF